MLWSAPGRLTPATLSFLVFTLIWALFTFCSTAWFRSPLLANLAWTKEVEDKEGALHWRFQITSASEKEASFMISPMVCLVSIIFFRMLRNFNCSASAFFFSSR